MPKNLWTQEEIEILTDGYKNGLSKKEIAKSLQGRSEKSITTKAIHLGLTKEYINLHSALYKAIYQDYDWLYERYMVKFMSPEEIAKEASTKPRTIRKWTERYGMYQIKAKREIPINDLQRELIMFSRLGDGHIDKRKTQPVFIVSHAENQKDYLYWKYEILKNLCNQPPTRMETRKEMIRGKQCVCKPTYRITTKVLNDLIPIRELSKSQIIEQLNEFGLAIHFLDDASYSYGFWELCYASFTDKEKELYRKVLKDKFGIDAHLRKDDRYIGFSKMDSEKINDIILRNIPNDLDVIQYKILKKKAG